jgi:sulfofructose kinase
VQNSSSAKVDVVGVGLNATDTIIRLPHFPAFDSKVKFDSSEVLPGGQVASAMVACSKWGLRARYVGKIGDDPAGMLQERELARAGVEGQLTRVAGCHSQSSFILVDQKSGERTVLWGRDERVALQPHDIRREWVVSARALFVDGHETAAAALAAQWAQEAGMPVVADFDNLYPGVEALLENVDFFISSREFPARLTGEQDLLKALSEIHRRYRNQMTGSTLGREGVVAWDGEVFHYFPAYKVETVDTTGAGDIFHAAFVYAQLQGWSIQEKLSFSCAAAALNCKALGARGGIAAIDEIQTLIRKGETYPETFPSRKFSRR